MKRLQFILLSMTLAITFLACGQNSSVFEALPNNYQIDHDKKIIVLNIDASEWTDNQFTSVKLNAEYLFSKQVSELENTHRYSVTRGEDVYTLFVTNSPIIAIHVKDSLTKHPKVTSIRRNLYLYILFSFETWSLYMLCNVLYHFN